MSLASPALSEVEMPDFHNREWLREMGMLEWVYCVRPEEDYYPQSSPKDLLLTTIRKNELMTKAPASPNV